MKNKGMNVRGEHPLPIKYVVEGRTYTGSMGVYREAVARGYVGTPTNIASRLGKGVSTWAELAKPVDQSKSRACKSAAAKKRAEMADAIAALDARKAAIKEAA
ncbi:MAG TPA: hypothetical protein VGE88_19045 [Lysobacter sp.]